MSGKLTKAQRAELERKAAQLTEEALEIERRVQRIRRQLALDTDAGRAALATRGTP